jgi:hypothetical protein
VFLAQQLSIAFMLILWHNEVKSLFTPVIARSEARKQSPDFKQLQPMRLLRYARNDSTGDFLRNHHG